MELAAVLARPKFDDYVDRNVRDRFLASVLAIGERVPIEKAVAVCRDPKDNRLLEVAVNGQADMILSGDKDLRVLGAHEGIPILSPGEFLTR